MRLTNGPKYNRKNTGGANLFLGTLDGGFVIGKAEFEDVEKSNRGWGVFEKGRDTGGSF
jgi:hypothetical protein